jgi:hypothetical protein
MNKKLWTNSYADLPCPNCEIGLLQYNKDAALLNETRESLENNEYHKNGIVYPEKTFLGTDHLKCSSCGEIVAKTFIQREDVRNVDENGPIIEIISYYPAPPIITIPRSCSETVRGILNQSFTLFWIDLNSCGNKIRVAVEALIEEQNIGVGSGSSLHAKIILFKAAHPNVANYLLAIKWIGNEGSHVTALNQEAILDAYQLMEYALEHLYPDKRKSIDELSNRINQAKKHVK